MRGGSGSASLLLQEGLTEVLESRLRLKNGQRLRGLLDLRTLLGDHVSQMGDGGDLLFDLALVKRLDFLYILVLGAEALCIVRGQ